MKKDKKQEIYYVKGIAIISVIMAHTPIVLQNKFTNQLWGNLGALGVPLFFIIAGYLFSLNTDSIKIFLYKKSKNLLPAWLFCGTLVYVISTLVGKKVERINVGDWSRFLLGEGSLFYYMTILCILYVVNFYIRKHLIGLIVIVLISSISILLTALGYLENINLYLNPLNFAIYFVIGIMLKDKWGKLLEICQQYYIVLLGILSILLVVATYTGQGGYTGMLTIPISLFGFCGVVGSFRKDKIEIMQEIGKRSFSIYLLHMPIAGTVNILFNKLGIFMLIKPLVVIGVMMVGIKLIQSAEKKYGIINKWTILIGL